MAKLGCICGLVIRDNTDDLPYKAYIREDEDVQQPVKLLADSLARYWEARQQGLEFDFIRAFEIARGEAASVAESQAKGAADKSLTEVLFDLIYPFWNRYERIVYECERCGRLWVGTEGDRCAPYLPETETRHVLRSRHRNNPDRRLDG